MVKYSKNDKKITFLRCVLLILMENLLINEKKDKNATKRNKKKWRKWNAGDKREQNNIKGQKEQI